MTSTLPRTRSASVNAMTGARRERVRPASMSDIRVQYTPTPTPVHGRVHVPSQAPTAVTTVPQNMTSVALGQRHVPTRKSLRHSRMIGMTKNGTVFRERRRQDSMSRVGLLVALAQALVGILGAVLAAWFVLWASSLSMFEVPHYAGVPVFLAGVVGVLYFRVCNLCNSCFVCAKIVRVFLCTLCSVSLVSCLCVCVFTTIHVVKLVPLSCQSAVMSTQIWESDLQALSHNSLDKRLMEKDHEFAGESPVTLVNHRRQRNVESDNSVLNNYHRSQANNYATAEKPPHLQLPPPMCVCNNESYTFLQSWAHASLSCTEAKNLLAVLFVASGVVSAVGAILSCVVFYLLWVFRRRPEFYHYHETKPFIAIIKS